MSKRQRHSAASPKDYLPFGKPAEVSITHVEAEKLEDGTIIEARYVERFKGFSSDTDMPERREPDRGDLHPTTCKGRLGVARTWERDGRQWCRGCYLMRYGIPAPEDGGTIKVRRVGPSRINPPQPASDLEKLMRSFKFL